jgi:hypothetical protein
MGLPRGSHSALRTLSIDIGPDGIPILGLSSRRGATGSDHPGSNPVPGQAINDRAALYKPIDVEPRRKGAPNFIVTFTEDRTASTSMPQV